MKRIILLFIIIANSYFNYSQNLSENAQVSLITCNPGDELYSVFGHSAIRIRDNEQGLDRVYNYGTFNFNTPNFYLKFARGYLNYELSAYSMHSFLAEYRATNRSVFEQVLILNQEEKERIFNFLEFNSQPENRFYLYDFFFDNCASRIRNVFKTEFKDSLVFETAGYQPKSFREMLKPYLKPHPWSRFGISLVLGDITDRQATISESMFLPDYLQKAFASAKLNGKLMAKPSTVLFKQKDVENNLPFYLCPIFVFSLLFLVVGWFTYYELKHKRRFKLFDFLLFLAVGVVGLILFLLWFATNHTAVVNNWNLLWAIPIHFFVAFWLFRKRKTAWLRFYFLVTCIISLATLLCWFFIPQQFDFVLIPILLTITVRAFRLFRYY